MKTSYELIAAVLFFAAAGRGWADEHASLREAAGAITDVMRKETISNAGRARVLSIDTGLKTPETTPKGAVGSIDSPLTDAPGKSGYAQLEDLYLRGVLPSRAELTGWFSGRCYYVASPMIPSGAMLMGAQTASESDFRFSLLESWGDAADHFDDLPAEKVAWWDQRQKAFLAKVSTAEGLGGSLTSRYGQGNLEFRIRKAGRYLITSSVLLIDRPDIERKAGETAYMCFFSKKVHD